MKSKFYPSNEFIVRQPYLTYKGVVLNDIFLEDLVKKEFFQEALFYASPELYSELKKYLRGNLSEKDRKRMMATIYKYGQRIHYRATPFGMFAFCGLGRYSKETKCSDSRDVNLHYRFDCQFLYDYISFVLRNADEELLYSLNVCSNQTILSVSSYLYCSVRDNNGDLVDIRLPRTEILDFIITLSKDNCTCTNLKIECLKKFDISSENLFEYIKNLILNGILISDINIETTGDDNFNRIYTRLKDFNIPLLKQMKETLLILKNSDEFEKRKNAIDSLYESSKHLGIKVNRNLMIQVDAFSNSIIKINECVKDQLVEWFNILLSISSEYGNPLTDFITRYRLRYEDEQVSILTALNKSIGIGYKYNAYKSDLFEEIFKLPFNTAKKVLNKNYNLTVIEQIVLDKLLNDSKSIFTKKVDLTYNDFKEYISTRNYDFPLSFSCMFKIIGYNEYSPILSGVNFSGTSASCLITRFADSLQGCNELLNKIASCEESHNNNVVLAEISHLSRPHAGNVQIRPSFRNHEIPFISNCNNNGTNKIAINDLIIYISHGKIKLVSTKLNKEVIPCFSSAFNYQYNTSDLYQFLGDIQHQTATRFLSSNVTTLLNLFKHIPRISYKNIIVSPETWIIEGFNYRSADVSAIDNFRSVHKSLKMPRYLEFSKGDNYYVLDIQSNLSVSEFFNLSKSFKSVVLKEFLPLCKDIKHYDSVIEIVQPFLPS